MQSKQVKLILLGILLGGMPLLAQATPFTVDEFRVDRNGQVFFQDTFDNGDPHNTGWVYGNNNAATYIPVPAALPGTEANSRYTIDPLAGDVVTSSLNGQLINLHRLRLATNTSNDPANLGQGLKDDDAIRVTGIFDLVMPTLLNERFGVRLTDLGSANGTDDDIVEVNMQLRKSGVVVQFREQDVLTQTYSVLGRLDLTAAALGLAEEIFALYDQIALILDRPDANSDVFGSFALLDTEGVAANFLYDFAGSATIFEGERFTRAELLAVLPVDVPEASTLGLLTLGLLFVAARRRKPSV